MLRGIKKHRLYKINGFSGLDRTSGCKMGEFCEMENLSSRNFPAMSPIFTRVKYLTGVEDLFLYDNEYFKITSDGSFYRGTKKITGKVSTGLHEFSVLGNYLIIMPDKLCYDMKKGVLKSMEVQWHGLGVFVAGEVFGYQSQVNTLHTEIDVSVYFNVGDCIEITSGTKVLGYFTIKEFNSGYILFENGAFKKSTGTEDITLKRTMPDLKNTFECNNRLWGSCDNVIYASALGDPFNFYKYRGISTDSYFKEIYSAGDFTAGAALGETPVFFKERAIYRIYGNTPDSFYVDVKEAIGVSADCKESLACLDGALYYAGTDGIYAYSSSYPTKISAPLGSIKVGRASGGTDERRYYVSFSQFEGISDDISDILSEFYGNRLYAYDSELGIWHVYDPDIKIKRILTGHFGSVFKKVNTMAISEGSEVYSLGDKPSGVLVDDLEGERVMRVDSYGITGIVDFGPCCEVNSIRFALELESEAEFYAEISFDGGDFERIGHITASNGSISKKITFRVPKKRFSYFRLKMGGRGEYSLSSVDIYYRSCYNEKG